MDLTWESNSISGRDVPGRNSKKVYGKHPIWTDGADWFSLLACQSTGLKKRHIYEKGSWLYEVTGEGAIQRLKDRTESNSMTCFLAGAHGLGCRLEHVWNWINVFWLHNQPECQFIHRSSQGGEHAKLMEQ